QSVKAALPQDLPAPTTRSFDPAQTTIDTFSVTSQSLSIAQLSAIVTNNVIPDFEQVDGVSSASANGVVTPALEVLLDPAKLAGRGFVPTDVVSAIQANNERAPGGIAYSPDRETSLDVRGDVQTAGSIAQTLLSTNTSVLKGATSPSGALTVKYSNTSGATNQALNLGSGAASSASSASSGAQGGGSSASSGSATASISNSSGAGSSGSSSSGTSATGSGESASVSTDVNAAASSSNVNSGNASAGETQTSPSSPVLTVVTPVPVSLSLGAPGSLANTAVSTVVTPAPLPTIASQTTSTAPVAGFVPPTYAPLPVATVAAMQVSGTTTIVTHSNFGSAGGVAASGSIARGSGAASSGDASDATEPFSTSALLPHIGDVATVTDGYEPKRVIGYVNGRPAISINVQKATGASEVQASEAVLAALPAIEAKYPDIAFRVLNVQADTTKAQLWGVLQTLIEGIVFTGIAMLIFLKSWRNAVVVLIAIPMSLFVTFFIMRIWGFTIDTVSLLAMTLIIGILVDDSIVVLENVERHFEDGEAPRTAAILGRSEIGAAAVVITLVDVVVFLPIAFLPGQTGRFLAEFGVVVTVATLTSLAISFTITPALAGNWSLLSRWRAPRPIVAFGNAFARARDYYSERILPAAMRLAIPIVVLAALLTLGAVALIPLGFVGFDFIPAVDNGQIFATIQYPSGTPLTTTDAAVRKVTDAFLQMDDVQQVISTTGTSQAGFGGSLNIGSTGQLRILLRPDRKLTTDQDARRMTGIAHRLVPDAKIVCVPATGTRGGNSQPIDITVATTRGEPDAYAAEVLQALSDTPGATNVNSSASTLAPQFDIVFNRDRARVLDVNIGLAAQAVRAAFGGTLATQFDTANGTKYVQVLYPQSYAESEANLRNISIRSSSGALIHLSDIATLVSSPTQVLITRNNRQTVIHIGANVAPGVAISNVQKDFANRVKALHLPDTVIISTGAGGTQANLVQTVNGLGVSLILSFALVYLLMVALYNAYRAPLVIMFAVPVAAVGALGALALTGQTLNLFSLIGVVMLIGLVSKNGILLVDFAELKVAAGMEKFAAMKAAARERFRPIVMTTVSMISGMLPLALALDPGSAAKRSLGTVVIGGLTSSLLLTLVVVPIMFVWIAPGPPKEASPEKAEGRPYHRPALASEFR
ncbi:MAG TPA: efflux RND transporter permease subunit, partial [Candidatus Acidoferrales bacterium]|nr:efflux RND transporter permease subunit [Candidatus Acidoferrales bacterium]